MPALDDLECLGVFRALTPQSRELLAQALVRKSVPRAAAVLHKGQPVSGAYVVLQGSLRVFTMAPNGNEATLYFIEPGEVCVLALNCLFNDLLYPAWVQAESDTRVGVIPGSVYRRLFESDGAVQDLTVRALSTLVYRLMDELEQVHSSKHKQRLAQFILMHAAADGTLRMTQQQLARHLGTTREVVARLMQGFVAHGWVQSQRGCVQISDLQGLRSVVWPAV